MSDKPDIRTAKRSVSQLQKLATCGHSYYLQKVLRVPQRTAAWFIQGTAVHAALELYESSWRSISEDEALAAFEWHWDHDMAEAEAKQPDHKMWMVGGRAKRETDIEKRWKLGRQQVLDYIGHNPPSGGLLVPVEIIPGEAAVEVGFEIDFDGVKVLGYIDCIKQDTRTGELIPEDWKTGSKLPKDPYQLATYGLAVTELTGQKCDWARWWMCKDNDALPMELTPYPWEVVTEWYHKADRIINEGLYLGNPSDDTCFTCTSKPYCNLIQPNPLPWPVERPGQDFS